LARGLAFGDRCEPVGVDLLWLGFLWLEFSCRDLGGFGFFQTRI
jgi:hypothetical protein